MGRYDGIISRLRVNTKEIEESAMALRQLVYGTARMATAISLSLLAGIGTVAQAGQAQTAPQTSAQSASSARPVGTIKAISGNTIMLTTDAETDVTVLVQEATKL